MRKFLSFVAVLAILAIAMPASAGHHHDRGRQVYYTNNPRCYYGGSTWSQVMDRNYNELFDRPLNDIYWNGRNIGNQFHLMTVDVFGNPAQPYGYEYHNPEKERFEQCRKVAKNADLKGEAFANYVDRCMGRQPTQVQVSQAPAPPQPEPLQKIGRTVTVVNKTKPGDCLWVFGYPINYDGVFKKVNYQGKLELAPRKGSDCKIKDSWITDDVVIVTCEQS